MLLPSVECCLGKVLILGADGMVGSAIRNKIVEFGFHSAVMSPNRQSLDLRDQSSVFSYFQQHRPDTVFLAAARVGGIYANATYPKDFIYDNLVIQSNVFEAALRASVNKFLFLGSSCIYPKYAEQPIREEYLLTGSLESSNEPYALAKICGIRLCEAYNEQHGTDYRALMPTNVYGLNDNYNASGSHVIPGLIRRFAEAKAANKKEVVIWGSGLAKREFLFSEDLARACVHAVALDKLVFQKHSYKSFMNVGSGQEVVISDLARLIASVIKCDLKLEFDMSMPDGTPRKLLDSERIYLSGWKPRISLKEGIEAVVRDLEAKGWNWRE